MTDDWDVGTVVVVKIASDATEAAFPATLDITPARDGMFGDAQGRLVQVESFEIDDPEAIDTHTLDGVIGRVTAVTDLGMTIQIDRSDGLA